MTAKLSDILSNSPQVINRRCRSCDWLEELPEGDYDAIREALASKRWPIQPLYRLLREQGLSVSESAFREHIEKRHQDITR
jgi:hypothetical protein